MWWLLSAHTCGWFSSILVFSGVRLTVFIAESPLATDSSRAVILDGAVVNTGARHYPGASSQERHHCEGSRPKAGSPRVRSLPRPRPLSISVGGFVFKLATASGKIL
jgi:hypothetical protein